MSLPSIVAGSNVEIIVDAGGYVLTGSTCVLRAAPGFPFAGQAETLGPMTVAPNGLTASYTAQTTDFPSGGTEWSLQMVVTTASGQVFASPFGQVYVYPRL